jgi:hypothetical protein
MPDGVKLAADNEVKGTEIGVLYVQVIEIQLSSLIQRQSKNRSVTRR